MQFLAITFSLTLFDVALGCVHFIEEYPICTEKGVICSQDCKSVQFCDNEGELPVTLFECPAGNYCSNATGNGACDSLHCGPPTQPCTALGAIPSPFNCSQYYLCGKLGQTAPPLVTCSESAVFDTMSKNCSKDEPCRESIKCTSPSQSGFVDPVQQQFNYTCDPSGFPIVYPNVVVFNESIGPEETNETTMSFDSDSLISHIGFHNEIDPNAAEGLNECNTTGPQCSSDCKRIILCPSDKGDSIDIATCPDDLYCKANGPSMQCSASYCGTADFLCTVPGAVPDPLDCSKYYLCPGVNVNGLHYSCDDGTKFDAKEQECRATANCQEVPECNYPGELGTVDGDKIFCYICDSRSLPVVYPCILNIGNETHWFPLA